MATKVFLTVIRSISKLGIYLFHQNYSIFWWEKYA